LLRIDEASFFNGYEEKIRCLKTELLSLGDVDFEVNRLCLMMASLTLCCLSSPSSKEAMELIEMLEQAPPLRPYEVTATSLLMFDMGLKVNENQMIRDSFLMVNFAQVVDPIGAEKALIMIGEKVLELFDNDQSFINQQFVEFVTRRICSSNIGTLFFENGLSNHVGCKKLSSFSLSNSNKIYQPFLLLALKHTEDIEETSNSFIDKKTKLISLMNSLHNFHMVLTIGEYSNQIHKIPFTTHRKPVLPPDVFSIEDYCESGFALHSLLCGTEKTLALSFNCLRELESILPKILLEELSFHIETMSNTVQEQATKTRRKSKKHFGF